MANLVEIKIENLDGNLYVSSRDIAKGLGKEHSKVMRSLKQIIDQTPNVANAIIPSKYNDRGRELDEYLLTKDGFTLYMFNIQGYNDFKMAYINRFNEMEKELQNQTPQLSEKDMLRLKLFSKDSMEVVAAHNRLIELETAPLLETIEEQQPVVDYAENVLTSNETLNTTQIAQDYGMSAVKFNKVLHELGIQYKSNKQWILYADYKDKGYVESETITLENGKVVTRSKWTHKGRKFLYEILKENGYTPVKELN